MSLVDRIKKGQSTGERCLKILAACEDPSNSFPSCAEEYDFAAFLYSRLSSWDETFPKKAYDYSLAAIKEGFHSWENINRISDYLFQQKNKAGLIQLASLLSDRRTCFRLNYNSGSQYRLLEKRIVSLTELKQDDSFSLFTDEERERIYNDCKRHIKIFKDKFLNGLPEEDNDTPHYEDFEDPYYSELKLSSYFAPQLKLTVKPKGIFHDDG